jgi:Protein of unknown function (DUF2853)
MVDFQEQKDLIAKYIINDAALHGMIKTYALVMGNKDASLVACSDVEERKTVRENFLKKKLGLTATDAELDAAIEEVCVTLKGEHFKSRIVFYYLLAAKYGKLEQFV